MVTVASVGDIVLAHRLDEEALSFMAGIRELFREADLVTGNLEGVLLSERRKAAYKEDPIHVSFGPACLEDLKALGFNCLTTANNHAGDYSREGMADTIKALKTAGIPFAGLGRDLKEAASPCSVKTKEGSVRVFSFTVSYLPGSEAGEGSPGINVVRTGPDLKPDRADVERIEAALAGAKAENDYVFISVHDHLGVSGECSVGPAPAMTELYHELIRSGADAVISHGAHKIRAVEVYENRPIIYSAGNFFLDLSHMTSHPSSDLEHFGCETIDAYISFLYEGFSDPRCWEALLPVFELDRDGLKAMRLYPLVVGGRDAEASVRGIPVRVKGERSREIIEYAAALSEAFDTAVSLKADGSGYYGSVEI